MVAEAHKPSSLNLLLQINIMMFEYLDIKAGFTEWHWKIELKSLKIGLVF